MSDRMNRRDFVAATAAAGLALGVGRTTLATENGAEAKPAVLGGKPAHTRQFSSWPLTDQREERAMLEVLRSGQWFRGSGHTVERFEKEYAKLTGAQHCLATSSGTAALLTVLASLDIGPGDEVIVPPYTFVATVNAVLLRYALPIFVDSDLETFQIDAGKIEAAITDRTALIMPVHLGGSPADLDTILAVAGKHKLPVVEDACQAHLAEWRGRKVGTLGTAGCFSFQVSKNLSSGEGGAIITADESLITKCSAFHNNSRPIGHSAFSYVGGCGANLRMTEFQGALLSVQMTRLVEQANARQQNAAYLTSMLKEVPGISPAKMYEGCTRNAYHLYMFRYDAKEFAGLSREKFIAALEAERIVASSGYTRLNREVSIKNALQSRGFKKIYSQAELDRWEERTRCPANDRLCDEAVWLTQNMFLGPRSDMDQIADAIRKIKANAAALAKA
ncbi:MAG: DegT/DnrJ/EryC1/StrS family aminotransferase [Planctomycetaceae bacterium]|nr:DegT/DnrJ/EryC1/StrS family aminotransferase [Planctomycetaceae bacterium]